MRKWSGVGQLKPVPWTTWIFSRSSRSRTNFSSSWILWTLGSRRGNAYSEPFGFTQDTPGISLSFSQATVRCSCSRPPGAVRSWMDWRPPSAAWMAYWAGALAHSRMEASMVRPSR
ncbi:hypothetical protein SALBM311S_04763 [Streptomyces alboniger]